MTKAQTSTEYLIILAVVIIVALVVFGVFSGITNIGGITGSRLNSAYWETASISIPSMAPGSLSTVFIIENNQRSSIQITQIKLDDNSLVTIPPLPLTLEKAESKKLTTTSITCDQYDFSYEVEISYNQNSGSNTFTGEGNKISGNCAN